MKVVMLVLLIGSALTLIVAGQTIPERLERLKTKQEAMDDQAVAQELKVSMLAGQFAVHIQNSDVRLALIEQRMSDFIWWFRVISTALLTLIINASWRIFSEIARKHNADKNKK